MEVDLLKQIVKNTEHKTSFQIIVSDNKSIIKTRLNPTLQLDKEKESEIALVNLETYYSFPNIDETNNVFVYSPDNGNSWVKIKIPEGSYEIDDINNTIQHEMEKEAITILLMKTIILTFPQTPTLSNPYLFLKKITK